MKENIIRFAFAAFLLTALQMSLLSQEKLKIVVIPKSNIAVFWKSVHAGVKLGSVALGNVEVVWRAPLEETALQQILSLSSVLQKVYLE